MEINLNWNFNCLQINAIPMLSVNTCLFLKDDAHIYLKKDWTLVQKIRYQPCFKAIRKDCDLLQPIFERTTIAYTSFSLTR